MRDTTASRLADFAVGLRYEDVPPAVAEAARLHLLDTLGCGLAADALGVGKEARTAMDRQGGEERSAAIGLGRGLPAPSAALANGMLCHALDFDDTHVASASHVSAVVCPAALAAGQAEAADGRGLLTAIVAGSEATIRIGMAAPMQFHRRGFHPTSVCGVFGATVAAARLAGLDAAATTSALGIAGSMASGLFAYLEDGTPTKPLHAGWAAHGGVLAATLAALGTAGPSSVLEGRFGLYHSFLDREPGEIDVAAQLDDLGERWETPRISYKPYPACHVMHAVLGAAREATGGETLSADAVESIVVEVPEVAVNLTLEPLAAKCAPRTDYEAKFSLPYSLAALLARGRVGLADYEPAAIADRPVLALAQKVTYVERPFPTYPQALPGAIEIRLASGDVRRAEQAFQEGGPGNPWDADRVRSKFGQNATLGRSEPIARRLEEIVLSVDEQPSLEPLGELLTLAPAREGPA